MGDNLAMSERLSEATIYLIQAIILHREAQNDCNMGTVALTAFSSFRSHQSHHINEIIDRSVVPLICVVGARLGCPDLSRIQV